MYDGDTIFVRRHGFLSALVLGVFGTIAIVVVCATAVGLYGLYIVDDKIEDLVAVSPEMVEALTDWQKALPPALADALDDRRDPSYRQHVEATVELLSGAGSRARTPVIEVINQGERVITLLSLRVALEDDDGIPIKELTSYAATPIAIDSDWRGPLLPGSKRRFLVPISRGGRDVAMASLEITELRVWQGEGTPDADCGEEQAEIPVPALEADDPPPGDLAEDISVKPATDSDQDEALDQPAPSE